MVGRSLLGVKNRANVVRFFLMLLFELTVTNFTAQIAIAIFNILLSAQKLKA